MHEDNAITAPTRETQQYFYHSDHLGSSTFITDVDGNVAQHLEYMPYGEVFVEERNNSWSTPYKFNGKELDEETGLYYYGARYYDPRTSVWVSVDPQAEKYPNISSYVYCAGNPVKYVDPDGKDIKIGGQNGSSVIFKTDLIDVSVDASSLGVDFGGTYTLQGEQVLGAALDIVGIFDPTGIADGLNAGLSAKNGEWLDAGISAIGLIPYAGDLAKAGKIKKDVKIIEEGIDAVKLAAKEIKETRSVKYLRQKAVKDAWKAEKELVEKTGQGTRRWTAKELKELKESGKVKGYQGHHKMSVKAHPEKAGDPTNIEFVTPPEHLERHGGNYRNQTHG